MLARTVNPRPNYLIKFGNRAQLITTAEKAIPSTVTLFRNSHPNLSGLSRQDAMRLASSLGLPTDIPTSELEQKLTKGFSNSTATWIDTNQGPMLLGCRHAIPGSNEEFQLLPGHTAKEGPPTFDAHTNPLLPDETIYPQWKLRVVNSDPVNDVAVWEPTEGPTPPPTIELANSNPFLHAPVVRIGRYGRIIPGEFIETKLGTNSWYEPLPTENTVTYNDLQSSEKVIVSGDTKPGDSGGPTLNDRRQLIGIHRSYVISDNKPVYTTTGEFWGWYNPNGLSGQGSQGASLSTIRRFLERHGLL